MRFWIYLLALPALSQNFSDIRIEKFTSGYIFTEGPVWSRDGYLIFSDAPNNQIWKAVPGEKPAVIRENSNGAMGTALDTKGSLYVCESRGRRVVRIDKKDTVEVVADKWEGKRLNGPNDVIVRKDGHVFFTDPAFGVQAQNRELDFYGIYHVPPRGAMEVIARWKGRPNGVALSPNGRTLYVSNSDERSIYAYDLDGKGAASNERVLAKGVEGVPDGIRVDEKGNLYVMAKGVAIYSPQGALIHTIDLAEMPRNCAFGDPDFQTLYITAYSAVYRIRLDVKGAVQY
jgi:gluconolactonase